MAKMASGIADVLSRGVSTSQAIQRELGLSQATVSRALAAMGDRVVRVGRQRAARYGLPLPIPGIGAEWPVFIVSEAGETETLGRLHALHRDQYWIDASIPSRSALTDGLPFFLQDLRPQGFIGRAVPRRYPELDLPQRVTDWNDSDVLTYLVRRGDDCIGNIILGDEALQRFLAQKSAPRPLVDSRILEASYKELAEAAIAGEIPGSSAGGEHPKFTCMVESADFKRNVLVKFSPRGDDPVSRRWSDLLVCEHLALTALAKAGFTATSTRLYRDDEQVFLEAERFDRVGVSGRRGVVSLGAIADALIGKRASWTNSVKSLRSLNKISDSDFESVRRVATFGRLIGNTDMHFGNLSFYLSFEGRFSLAPIYDMLPMAYAPTAANAVSNRDLDLPLPTGDCLDIWRTITELATDFWRSVQAHKWISREFAMLAERNETVVRAAARLA